MDFDSWDTSQLSQTSSPVVKTPTKPMEIKSRTNGFTDALSTNGSNMGIDEDIISVEASSLDSESSWDSFVSAPTTYDGTGSNVDLTEADKVRDLMKVFPSIFFVRYYCGIIHQYNIHMFCASVHYNIILWAHVHETNFYDFFVTWPYLFVQQARLILIRFVYRY